MNYNKATNLGYFTTPALTYWTDTKCYKQGTVCTTDRPYRLKNIAVCTIGASSVYAGMRVTVPTENCSHPCVRLDFIVYHSDHYANGDLTAFDSAPAVVSVDLYCGSHNANYAVLQRLCSFDPASVLGELIDITHALPYSFGDRLDADSVKSLAMRLDEQLCIAASDLRVDVWATFPFQF